MSVEKINFTSVDNQVLPPFTVHFNAVLQNLRDPIALAIWAYLTSRPRGWRVNRTELQDHFDLGRDRTNKALKLLHDLKLLRYEQTRDEHGNFTESKIVMLLGYEFIDEIENNQQHDTATLKTRATDYPRNGETATIKERININKRKSIKERKIKRGMSPDGSPDRRTRISEKFTPNQKHYDLAKSLNVSVMNSVAEFIDYYQSNGKKMINWNACYSLWIRRSAKFAQENKNKVDFVTKTIKEIKDRYAQPAFPKLEELNTINAPF